MDIRVPCSHCGKVLTVNESTASRVGTCPYCHQKIVVGRFRASDTPQRSADTPTSSADRRGSRPAERRSGSSSSGSGSNYLANSKAATKSDSSPPTVDPASQDTHRGISADSEPELKAPSLSRHGRLDPLTEDPDAIWYVRSPTGGQFGPASNEVMRTWIQEGRVGVQSFVWRAGWADWLAADRVFDTLLDSPANRVRATGRSSRAAEYLEMKRRRSNKPSRLKWIGLFAALGLIGLVTVLIIWLV